MSGDEKAAVIREIQRLAEQNGGVPVGRDRFIVETGFPDYYWQGRHWLSWSDAVREAGYEPNAMQHRRHTDDDLLRHLALLTSTVGRFPTNAHLRMERRSNPEFPSANVFGSRLGTRDRQIDMLRDFIERTPEFADIVALLRESSDEPATELSEDDVDDSQPVPGWV